MTLISKKIWDEEVAKAKRYRKTPVFSWVATHKQRVQHCHFNRGMRGAVCNGIVIYDVKYWLTWYPQPVKRCKRCTALLRRALLHSESVYQAGKHVGWTKK